MTLIIRGSQINIENITNFFTPVNYRRLESTNFLISCPSNNPRKYVNLISVFKLLKSSILGSKALFINWLQQVIILLSFMKNSVFIYFSDQKSKRNVTISTFFNSTFLPEKVDEQNSYQKSSLLYKEWLNALLTLKVFIYCSSTKMFEFLNQCFAQLWWWKKCFEFTKPTCWINSCFAGDTFLRPKSCKTLI